MTAEVVTQSQEPAAKETPASTPTQTGAANPGSTEAKFTQADLDREIAARVQRAADRELKVKADLLKQLGLDEGADFNALKSTIEEARKRKEADMTEAQKAQAERDEVKKKADALQAQLDAERAAIRQEKVNMTFENAAKALKANRSDDVLRYARDEHRDALADLTDEDGKVDTRKLDALLAKIKEARPDYFTPPANVLGSQSNANGRALPSAADAMKRASQTNQRIIRGR